MPSGSDGEFPRSALAAVALVLLEAGGFGVLAPGRRFSAVLTADFEWRLVPALDA
jgi:hypothetical protein